MTWTNWCPQADKEMAEALEKGRRAADERLERLKSAAQMEKRKLILAAKQEQVETDVKEMKADVKTLIGKPARRWDAMVDKVLWAVVAAVVAFVLGRVGL